VQRPQPDGDEAQGSVCKARYGGPLVKFLGRRVRVKIEPERVR